MGFAELLAAVALFVGMPWAIFSGIARVKAASGSGEGLRRSELEAIIRTAVEDATDPLVRRIETLEAIAVDDEPGSERLDPAVLAGVLDVDPEADGPAAVRHRHRTRA